MPPDPTIADVLAAIGTLSAEIKGVESRLDAKIDGVESRLDAKIDSFRTDLKADIAAAQRANVTMFNAMRQEIREYRDEVQGKGLLR